MSDYSVIVEDQNIDLTVTNPAPIDLTVEDTVTVVVEVGTQGPPGPVSEALQVELAFDLAYPSNYKTLTYTSNVLTRIDIFDTSLEGIHLFSKVFTYTAGQLTQVVTTHLTTGHSITKTLQYSGSQLENINQVYA